MHFSDWILTKTKKRQQLKKGKSFYVTGSLQRLEYFYQDLED